MDDLSTVIGFLVILALVLAVLVPVLRRSARQATPGQRAAGRARRDGALADQQWDDMNRHHDSGGDSGSND